MKKLINFIQYYNWGSHTALNTLFSIPNPDNRPMAELWMGAHPKCSSHILENGNEIPLNTFIEQHQSTLLGERVTQQFGELPFLFKVLCAAQPLSIQVHPNKHAAEVGFYQEQHANIPLNSETRNYKDANHKPELIYALTPFTAMNGFRPLAEIQHLFTPFTTLYPAIDGFLQQADQENLKHLFTALLGLNGTAQQTIQSKLAQLLNEHQGEPWQTIRFIKQFYPNDNGLLAPLLLNIIKLNPGEAMFLYAETPHAYLHGTGLEVMANSDNVLRAGLTPKFIDIPELLANVKFTSQSLDSLLMQPHHTEQGIIYPIPVADFAFAIHPINNRSLTLTDASVSIMFCLSGEVHLNTSGTEPALTLQKGESAFIGQNEYPIILSGQGNIARVYIAQ